MFHPVVIISSGVTGYCYFYLGENIKKINMTLMVVSF